MALPIKWKILVIDDEQDLRDILSVTLTDAGYSVICAPDGHTGLMLATREEPQIVITDIKMPGFSGLEVLEKIKKIKPETEVIVTTGFGDVQKAVTALQYDASDFISKPIDDAALHMALKRAKQRYINRKQLSDYTILLENENVKTSAELVKNVNFQSSLIENSIDGILGCDENQIIVTYNRSMEMLLGYPKAQVLKKIKPMALFKPALFLKLKTDLSNKNFGGKNRLFVYETAMLSFSKEDIPVQISGFIFTQGTDQNNMVLFIRDLRTLRTLEQKVTDQAKLLHREKMISLGRLAASMVHEINNPLSGILNYIRLMIRINGKGKGLTPGPTSDLTQDPVNRFNSYLEIIESETQRCSDLVSGLLKFSRKTKLEQKSIDVAKLIRHSLLLCNHKLELSNIVLRLKCDPDVPCVYGDFNQLEQCMINLIFNGADAMDTFDAMKSCKNLDVRTGYSKEENLVSISIKDTGKGISKEDLPFIFEPFFTTKTNGYGVGLGLSSAYGIIEKHRGTIVVESRLKVGSEFIIKLPPER